MDPILSKICVEENMPIKDAIRRLHEGHQRIIMIVDGQNRLQGVVSDSDIRNAMLKGISFDRAISEIMVRNPVVGSSKMSDAAVLKLMKTKNRFEVPILNEKQQVVGLKTVYHLLGKKPAREAVIMAGGFGTRLRPLTDAVPKPLLMVGKKPILFIILDQLIQHEFSRVTITINYKAEMIREAIAQEPSYRDLVEFIEESEPLGTAGAISLLDRLPQEPFFVINADLLTKVDIQAMMEHHEREKNEVTVAVKEENLKIPFGVVSLEDGLVTNIQEKPAHSFFINAGIYVLSPSVVSEIPPQTHFTMTELINKAINKGRAVGSFPVYEYWLDIGAHETLSQANQTFDS